MPDSNSAVRSESLQDWKRELSCSAKGKQHTGNDSPPDFRTGSCPALDSRADAIDEQQLNLLCNITVMCPSGEYRFSWCCGNRHLHSWSHSQVVMGVRLGDVENDGLHI